jgi:hypothetical protein
MDLGKLSFKRKIFRCVIVLSALILFIYSQFSCDLFKTNLGDKVDISKPEVSVSSPTANSYVKGAVTLNGEASDDIAVASVVISYLDQGGVANAITSTLSADSSASVTWSVTIPITGGDTAIADGGQTFSITVTDSSGKTTIITHFLYIDNSAPVVLINAPQGYGNASDRTTISNYLDVEGKAYDINASPIASVVVSITNTSGTTLATKTATGDNTWSARFVIGTDVPASSFTDNGIYRILVSVTDKAGNVNPYCYHEQDIWDLLGSSGTVFPSLSEIAGMDQKATQPSFNYGANFTVANLISRRVNDPSAAIPTYVDFAYSADGNKPIIAFSNIDTEDSVLENKLASQAPVSGYVRPGPAGTAVDNSSIAAYYQQEGASDWTKVDSAAGTGSLELSSVNGYFYFNAYLKDASGYLANGKWAIKIVAAAKSGSASSSVCNFYIDSSAPALSISPANGSTVAYDTANSDIDLTLQITDDNALSGATTALIFISAYTTYSNGVYSNPIAGTISIPAPSFSNAGKTAEYAVSIPLTSAEANGTVYLKITAQDLIGTSVSSNVSYLIDTEKPDTPTISSPTAGNYISGSAMQIIGATTNSSGTEANKVASVYYWLGLSTDSAPAYSSGQWNLAEGTVSWSKSVAISGLAEGTYKLHVIALDSSGNESDPVTVTFYIDQSAPRATETLINTSSLVKRTGTVNLAGQADDAATTAGRQATTATLTYSYNGGATQTATNWTWNPVSGAWSWTLDASSGDGLYTLNLTVTDIAGKVSSVTRTIQVDSTPPEVTITVPANNESTADDTFSISGTSRDSGVGFDGTDDVEYKQSTDASWTKLSLGSASTYYAWTGSLTLIGEGQKTLNLRSTDLLGNQSFKNVTFFFDKTSPDLTETTVGSASVKYSNAAISFSGEASDSWSLDDTHPLTVSIDGGAESDITVSSGSWNYSFATAGTHSLVFTAKDKAGKTTSLTRNVVLDTVVPYISAVTDLGTAWNKTASFALSGTSGDALSGIDHVEYRIVSSLPDFVTAYTAFAGTASFSGTVTFPDGTSYLQIRAMDKAGNYCLPGTYALSQQTVKVDTAQPIATITSPAGTPSVTLSSGLSVTLGINEATSGMSSVSYKIGDNDFSSGATTTSTSSLTPTINIASSAFTVTTVVYFRVTDVAGNNSPVINLAVNVDTTAPSLNFSLPASNATVNKTISLSGTASDTNSLASLAIYRYNGGAWDAMTNSGTIYSWQASLDTTGVTDGSVYDSNAAAGTIQTQFKAVATDAAGNDTTVYRTVTVDQETDKPVIKLNNLDTYGSATLKGTSTIYGTITDDDGIVSKLFIKNPAGVASTDFVEVDLTDTTFTYDLDSADGSTTLYFEIQDAAGTTFTSGAALPPRLLSTYPAANIASGTAYTIVKTGTTNFMALGSSSNAIGTAFTATGNGNPSSGTGSVYKTNTPYTGAAVSFKLDTTNPTIDGESVDLKTITASDYSDYSAASAFYGGTNTGKFLVRFMASDANGIASATVKVTSSSTSNTQGAAYDSGSGFWITSDYVDVTALTSGSATMDITVTDGSGLSSTISKTLTVDNVAPSFGGITSPTSGAIVNGNVTLNGSCSDVGVGIASVRYWIGLSSNGAQTWASLSSGSLYAWQLALNVDTYANATYATYDAGNETYKLPIRLEITDKAGDVTTTLESDYFLTINPNADRPTVSLTYPLAADSPLGGSIRVYGTAEDDDSVYAVYMQVDVNNDSAYTAADTITADFNTDGDTTDPGDTIDWYAGGVGQTVTGTNNWSQKLNTVGEFNPSGADTSRTIHARVRALDKTGNTSGSPAAVYGPWVETTITFDNNTPKIGSGQNLWIYQGSSASPSASTIYAEGMYASGDWVFGGSIEDETSLKEIIIESPGESALNLAADIKIDGAGNLSGTHAEYVETKTLIKRYDLTLPLNTAGLAAKSGTVKFTIKATDNTNKTATTSVTVYYDNQAPYSSLSTTGPVVNTNGYFDVAGIATDIGSSITKIELYFVRPYLSGQTVNGTQYKGYNRFYNPATGIISNNSSLGWASANAGITAINGAVYGSDGSGSATSGSFYYPSSADYIISVDHLGYTEYLSGGTIQNSDGDPFVEKLILSAGNYAWSGSFDSSLMPDGPIQIHYVIYDKAGNKTHYELDAAIRNNALTVSSITLGTDLDGSGSVTASEQTTYTSYAATGFTFKAAPATFDVSASGGNGDLYYSITGSNGAETLTQTGSLRVSGVAQQISLAAGKFASFADGAATFTLAIYDSTEESSYGDADGLSYNDSQTSTVALGAAVDMVDNNPPTLFIRPFYWNGYTAGATSTDNVNSIFANQLANGHVDIASNSGNGTGDPDISGKISLRGGAFDDQRITAIYAYLGDGSSAAGDFAFTGRTTVSIGGLTYYELATYSGGAWTGSGDASLTNGWCFTAANVNMDQSGHRVDWRLDWNSALISGGAALNRQIRIATKDKTTGQYSATSSVSSSLTGTADSRGSTVTLTDDALIGAAIKAGDLILLGTSPNLYATRVESFTSASGKINFASGVDESVLTYTVYLDAQNTPSYQVDVVPYIISITDSSASAGKSPYSDARLQDTSMNPGKTGYYSFYQGAVGVTLTGFNLLASTTTNGTNYARVGATDLTVTAAAAGFNSLTLTLPATLTTSSSADEGLTVMRNGVVSTNNLNANGATYNAIRESSFTDDRMVYIDEQNPSITVADFGKTYPTLDYDDSALSGGGSYTNGQKAAQDVSTYTDNISVAADATFSTKTSKWYGHVEYAAVSPYNTGTADISGVVIFRGKAADNQRVWKISAQIPNFDPDGGGGAYSAGSEFPIYLSTTNASGTTTGVFQTGLSYGWSAAADGADNVISASRLSKGHVLNWAFTWDSSKLSSVTYQALTITFRAYDMNNTAHSTQSTITVDVVPYVTSIERGASYRTGRSAEGRYEVRRAETLYVNGFNLYNGTYAPTLTLGGAAASISASSNSTSVTLPLKSIDTLTTTAPLTSSSGTMALTAGQNGISMLNNSNNNNAVGNGAVVYYNRENTASSSSDGSALWTDDRKVHVWLSDNNQTTGVFGYFTGSSAPIYPAMTYGGGTLYASWSNLSAASVYYGNNGNTGSRVNLYSSYDPMQQTDISYGSRASVFYYADTYGNGGWDASGAGGLQLWDGTIGAGSYYIGELLYHDSMLGQFSGLRVVTSGNYNFLTYYDTDTKALKYQCIPTNSGTASELVTWVNVDGGSDMDDKSTTNTAIIYNAGTARTVATVNYAEGDTVTNGATLMTLSNGFNVTATTGGTIGWIAPVGFATVRNFDTVLARIVTASGTTRIVASANRSSAAGSYSAIDLTTAGRPVIAYYDTSNQTVKIAHSTGTTDANTGYATWTIQYAMASDDPNYHFSGKYISLRIDSSNYLHMVFYNNSTGDLVYMKSTNAPTNGSTDYAFGYSVTVDSIGSVGSGADISLNGTLPYVSYYDSSLADSFNGLKLAYMHTSTAGSFIVGQTYVIATLGTTDFTGIGAAANTIGLSFIASGPGSGSGTANSWDYMNAPLVYNVALDSSPRTSVEYNSGVTLAANAASTSNTCWAAGIGYKSDDYYRLGYLVYGN